MPSIEQEWLTQKAVLWEVHSPDNYGENFVHYPVEICCRWEKRLDQVADGEGNAISTVADVWVDRDIEIGSIMWKGSLDDLPSIDKLTSLHLVKFVEEVPDIKGREREIMLKLARYTDRLPDQKPPLEV